MALGHYIQKQQLYILRYFWSTEQQQALQRRWKWELPGLDKVMGTHSPSSIHYLHKEMSYEKSCHRKDEIKQVNAQSNWL